MSQHLEALADSADRAGAGAGHTRPRRRTRGLASAIALASLLGASGLLASPCGAPFLVADLNTTPVANRAAEYLPLGSRTVFAATSPAYGNELFVTDGTPSGTSLLADVVPGMSGSSPLAIGSLGNAALYSTSLGIVLTDGTAAGTGVVASALVLPIDPLSAQPVVGVAGGILYFPAQEPATGQELWRSDGTAAGTHVLADIAPGPSGTSIYWVLPVGSTLYFGINSGEIWRTDGTAANTTRVMDCSVTCSYARPAARGSDLLFPAGTQELWKLDTVTGIPSLVRGGLQVGTSVAFAGAVYFAGDDGASRGLWKSDGTAAGTTFVASGWPARFAVGNGKLFYSTTAGAATVDLFTSDGTTAGTRSLGPVVSRGDQCGEWCWRNAPLLGSTGGVVFRGTDALAGDEPWTSDGTVAGTFRLGDLEPGPDSSSPENLAPGGDVPFYFAAYSSSTWAESAWRTDGTTAGTVPFRPFAGQTEGQSSFAELIALGTTLFFPAFTPAAGTELWRSDGTTSGTTLVSDVLPGIEGSDPFGLTTHRGALYHVGKGTTPTVWDYELWRSDGTASGTARVLDIEPGDASSSPHGFLSTDDGLYFSATQAATGTELWRSDGTASGTSLVIDLRPGPTGSSAAPVATLPAGLLFSSWEPSEQRLNWTDGTAAGTWQLAVRSPRPIARRLDGLLYVMDSWGSLWSTDGTPAGTLFRAGLAVDGVLAGSARGLLFVTSANGLGAYDPLRGEWTDLGAFSSVGGTAVGTTYYFSAVRSGMPGLWKTDGTLAGTVQIDTAPASRFLAMGGELYYARGNGSPLELWRTDGTVAGTYAIAPGLDLSTDSTKWLVRSGDELFFFATAPATGRELYGVCFTPQAAGLLRNTDARPPAPAAADLLPLGLSRDRYVDDFQSGSVDPAPVVTDVSRPLVFYALDADDATVLLAKTPALGILVELR